MRTPSPGPGWGSFGPSAPNPTARMREPVGAPRTPPPGCGLAAPPPGSQTPHAPGPRASHLQASPGAPLSRGPGSPLGQREPGRGGNGGGGWARTPGNLGWAPDGVEGGLSRPRRKPWRRLGTRSPAQPEGSGPEPGSLPPEQPLVSTRPLAPPSPAPGLIAVAPNPVSPFHFFFFSCASQRFWFCLVW